MIVVRLFSEEKDGDIRLDMMLTKTRENDMNLNLFPSSAGTNLICH